MSQGRHAVESAVEGLVPQCDQIIATLTVPTSRYDFSEVVDVIRKLKEVLEAGKECLSGLGPLDPFQVRGWPYYGTINKFVPFEGAVVGGNPCSDVTPHGLDDLQEGKLSLSSAEDALRSLILTRPVVALIQAGASCALAAGQVLGGLGTDESRRTVS